MTPRRAVVLCGARWWGDPSLDPSGRPVNIKKKDQRAFHMARSKAEVDGAAHEIGRLPDDCIVIHSPERGASRELGLAAARADLTMMVVPRDLLIETVLALRAAGWEMKVLVAGGDPEIVEALGRGGLFISEVLPWVEPEPEPDPEPGPDPDTPVSE